MSTNEHNKQTDNPFRWSLTLRYSDEKHAAFLFGSSWKSIGAVFLPLGISAELCNMLLYVA